METIKLAMFDLDGTLYDTSMSNFYSYEEAIKKICGISIDKDFFVNKCFGRNYRSFLPDLRRPAFEIFSRKQDKACIRRSCTADTTLMATGENALSLTGMDQSPGQ